MIFVFNLNQCVTTQSKIDRGNPFLKNNTKTHQIKGLTNAHATNHMDTSGQG